MRKLKTLAVAVAVIALSASTAFAHGDDHMAKKHAYDASKIEDRAFGREGDPTKVTRTVRLDMTDALRFAPADVTVKRGETVKFVVANSGKQLHEMVLGTTQELKEHAALMKKFPEMEHADANMAHVKPGAKGEIVWQFTKAGEYQFACLIPGHYEAGMVGKVVVK
jgi:uncharacterized cupredoxin-like copper-binding protein